LAHIKRINGLLLQRLYKVIIHFFDKIYNSVFPFDDAEADTVLRERYLRIKAQEANQDSSIDLGKLRAKSVFDDSGNE
jgi:hypothetical protein